MSNRPRFRLELEAQPAASGTPMIAIRVAVAADRAATELERWAQVLDSVATARTEGAGKAPF
jgi:hypothetical protein